MHIHKYLMFTTCPHHSHPKKKKETISSNMTRNPDVDLHVLFMCLFRIREYNYIALLLMCQFRFPLIGVLKILLYHQYLPEFQ